MRYYAVALLFFIGYANAGSLSNESNISIQIGGYTKHIVPDENNPNQGLDNWPFKVAFRVSDDDDALFQKVVFGTLKNSHNNRCLLLGVSKNWHSISNRISFESSYFYVGEFFFDKFSRCGDDGIYGELKDAIGVGFAPYIYHGVKYDLNRYTSINAGVLFPLILVGGIQFHF